MNSNDQLNSKTEIELVSHNLNLTDMQLKEYHNMLAKFIDLVPHLQEINKEEKINKIFCSAQSTNSSSSSSSSSSALESLQNLDINSKSISDLQILESVICRIHDLQSHLQSDS